MLMVRWRTARSTCWWDLRVQSAAARWRLPAKASDQIKTCSFEKIVYSQSFSVSCSHIVLFFFFLSLSLSLPSSPTANDRYTTRQYVVSVLYSICRQCVIQFHIKFWYWLLSNSCIRLLIRLNCSLGLTGRMICTVALINRYEALARDTKSVHK